MGWQDAPEVSKAAWETAPIISTPPVSPAVGATPVKILTAPQEQPKYSYEDLYKNEDLFNIIKDYSKVAMKTEPKEGQSREAFVADFMSKMRGVEFNAILDTVPELNKMRNAKPEDAAKMALAHKVYERTASVFEKEGQSGVRPYWDALKAIATDPSNYIGFGIGAVGKKIVTGAAKAEAMKLAAGAGTEAIVKSKLSQLGTKVLAPTAGKVTAAATGAESAIAVGQNVISQRVGQEVAKVMGEPVPELDSNQMAVAALFGAVGGFAEARGAMAFKPSKTGAEQLQELIQEKAIVPKDPLAPLTKVERTLLDPVTENMDTLVDEFNKVGGQKILDEISPITPLAEGAIQRDLSARAIRVAMHIIDQDPAFRIKPNQKTSSAINEVFAAMDKGDISDTLLEQAIRKEGLTPEEFAKANLMTVTQAAQVMQQYSAASRVLNKLTQIDPEAKKLVDSLFSKPNDIPTALGFVGDAISRVERESKAWMVSGVATTVRNVIGTGVGLTYNSAASLIEGSLYTIGKTLSSASKGTRIDTLKSGMADTMKDAFSVYGLLYKQGLAEETTSAMLRHNPAINNALFSATQEGSINEVSKLARVFNTLNVAQDAFFRKAIFTASVDKHMRRAGLDMYQVIGEGKVIPADILKQSTDETLKATFSYAPKQQAEAGFEAGAESAGNLFVKAMELPGLSLVAPFARFMSNAIAFQYRYSVFGAVSGAQDILQGGLLKSTGREGGDFLVRQGTENLAKGVVGVGTLAYAYDYRLNNQDTEWFNHKQDDGSTIDLRALFPAGPTLAVADFLAKRKLGLEPKTAEMVEAIIGMKMPAGTTNTLLDQIFAAASSEKDADKLEVTIGKLLGDFTTRFTQPFVIKNVYDFLDLFREGGAVQRDPNVITSDDKITEAAKNRIQKRIPIAKEGLPEYQPYLREGPVYQEGEFFNNLIGVRSVPEKSKEEREITRLNIEPFKLYGGTTGNKEFDREFVKTANPLVTQFIDRAMANDRYKALSPTEQKEALMNTVRTAVGVARVQTEAQFTSKDIDEVYKMKFNKLSSDKRKIINERYAKDHEGVTLEQAKDYKAINQYEAALADLQFAIGGLVAKAAKGLAKTKPLTDLAETATKTLATEEIDQIVNKSIDKALGAAPTAVDQTSAAMLPVKKKAKVAAQPSLEAAVPVPSVKAPVEAVAQPKADVLDTLYDDLKDAYPNKPATTALPFPPEAYAKGEADLVNDFGAKYVENMKQTDPKDFANMLHVYAGDTLGLKKGKGLPPLPHEVADTHIVKYDDQGNPIPVGGIEKKTVGVQPEQESIYTGEYLTGNLKDLKLANTDTRKQALAEIKDARKRSFYNLVNSPKLSNVSEEAVAIAQGDFRVKTGYEINPTSEKDMATFADIAKSVQANYDVLKQKYKNVPPVKLFHGGSNAETLKAQGFNDPQQYGGFHSELNIGAPSFTKDIGLGATYNRFGGKRAQNYIYTEMPYADYMLSRINLRPAEYDTKDLGAIARSITGSANVVRPISLPRGSFSETEDIMVEAEKLRPNARSDQPSLKSAESVLTEPKVNQPEGTLKSTVDRLAKLKEDRALLKDYGDVVMDDTIPLAERRKTAYLSYDLIKTMMNDLLGAAQSVSTKKGLGHTYQDNLSGFADQLSATKKTEKIIKTLDDMGAVQKAKALRDLLDKMDTLSGAAGYLKSPTGDKAVIDALNAARKAGGKLAKGGFVSKR